MATPDAYPVSGLQKNVYHEILQKPPVAPDFARGGAANPNLKVFVANFDGTANDRDDVPDNEQSTLVAVSDRELESANLPHIESRYFAGVGTRTGALKGFHEKLWGTGCERNAKNAHTEFVKQVSAWRKENPDVEVHVHVVGFSRGAATALHFMNLVDQHGAHKKNAALPKNDRFSPGRVKTSAVLFDHVSTGQSDKLMLGVPSTTVAVLHLTAGGEQRALFPLHSVANASENEKSFVKGARMLGAKPGLDGRIKYQRIQEIELPAARHSDVGGSYVGGGIREISKFLADHFSNCLGLPINPVKPDFMDVQKLEFHDSRFIKLSSEEKELQFSQREVLSSDTEVNHNQFVLATKLEGIGMRARTYTTFRSEPIANLPGSLDDLVGGKFDLQLGYDPFGGRTDFPNQPHLHIISQRGPFEFNDGKIEFFNRHIHPKSLGEIEQELGKKWAAGDGKSEKMTISVDVGRVGVKATVNQSPDAPEPEWFKPESEVFTKEFLTASKKLNERDRTSTLGASALFNQVMYGAAKTLQGNPDVDTVKIYPYSELNKAGSTVYHSQKFEIECQMKDGTIISTRSLHAEQNIAPFQGDLRFHSECLSNVALQLSERGVKPTKACEQVFENGCDRPKRGISMAGMDRINNNRLQFNSSGSLLTTLLAGPIEPMKNNKPTVKM